MVYPTPKKGSKHQLFLKLTLIKPSSLICVCKFVFKQNLKPMSAKKEAKIRGYHSIRMLMEPGEYYFCACGRTENNPFCDGSHLKENTGIDPIPVKIRFKHEVKWCDCRQSKSLPLCDHSHRDLPGYEPKYPK